MTATNVWKSRIYKLIAAAMLLGAPPAFASDTRSLDIDAGSEYNAGLDAAAAGQNQYACIHFRNAAGLWNNAIYSIVGNGQMATEDGRRTAKQVADQLQVWVDKAKNNAAAVCGLSDNPPPRSSTSAQSSNPDNSGQDAKEYLRRTQKLANDQIDEASRLLEAGDHAGACAKARLFADNLAKIADALRANPTYRSYFNDPEKVFANATLGAEVRDTVFCAKAN